jgi:hypothetical protein
MSGKLTPGERAQRQVLQSGLAHRTRQLYAAHDMTQQQLQQSHSSLAWDKKGVAAFKNLGPMGDVVTRTAGIINTQERAANGNLSEHFQHLLDVALRFGALTDEYRRQLGPLAQGEFSHLNEVVSASKEKLRIAQDKADAVLWRSANIIESIAWGTLPWPS